MSAGNYIATMCIKYPSLERLEIDIKAPYFKNAVEQTAERLLEETSDDQAVKTLDISFVVKKWKQEMFESEQICAALGKLIESFESVNIRPILMNVEFQADSEFNLESEAMINWREDIENMNDCSVKVEYRGGQQLFTATQLRVSITQIDKH